MKTITDAANVDGIDLLMQELGFQDSVRRINTPEAFFILGENKEGEGPVMHLVALFGFAGSLQSH